MIIESEYGNGNEGNRIALDLGIEARLAFENRVLIFSARNLEPSLAHDADSFHRVPGRYREYPRPFLSLAQYFSRKPLLPSAAVTHSDNTVILSIE